MTHQHKAAGSFSSIMTNNNTFNSFQEYEVFFGSTSLEIRDGKLISQSGFVAGVWSWLKGQELILWLFLQWYLQKWYYWRDEAVHCLQLWRSLHSFGTEEGSHCVIWQSTTCCSQNLSKFERDVVVVDNGLKSVWRCSPFEGEESKGVLTLCSTPSVISFDFWWS